MSRAPIALLVVTTLVSSGLLAYTTSRQGRQRDASHSRVEHVLQRPATISPTVDDRQEVATSVMPLTAAGASQGSLSVDTNDVATSVMPTTTVFTLLNASASSSWSNVQEAVCMHALYPHCCNNRGGDRCNWIRPNPCGFGSNVNLTEALANKTVVFRGDSTLRELFTMFSFFNCDPAKGVMKQDANWSFRTSHERSRKATGFQSVFQFDFELDHLKEPLSWKRDAARRPIKADVVVISLGMYNAKNYSKPASEVKYTTEDIPKYLHHIADAVCKQHGAKVGVFLAQMMECRAMRKSKLPTVKRNAAICTPSWRALQTINGWVREFINNGTTSTMSALATAGGGCRLYYVPHYDCHGGTAFCTSDGVHGRSHSSYLRTKVEIVSNALRLLARGL